MQYLTTFMNEYGYLVLFLSLALGVIALPVPMEAIMSYAGFLSFHGQLNWFGSILSASSGCTLGMILSYLIGFKLGMPFFEKYGPRFHFGPERLNSASAWFTKYGNKLLIIIFFIPVVRHVTGYFSGVSRMPIKFFAIYSFIGSVLWVSPFILLGNIFGPNWPSPAPGFMKLTLLIGIFLTLLLLGFYIIRKFKKAVFSLKKERIR